MSKSVWLSRSALKGAVSLIALVTASPALASGTLPTSGQYVAGKGAVAKDGSKGLTINQSSASGIIDWKSFSIGKKNSVDFNNGSGATLNRVTGGNLSSIAGSLHATGSVYVINSAGVMVGKNGRIDTGGTFAASSGDTSDSSFMDGKKLRFHGAKGDVSNAGSISSKTGDVILIGRAVKNTGSLSAEHGTASLNAGTNVYLAPAGSTGNILVSGGQGSATNAGTINAAQAQINAAGGNVYALSGNNGGIIRATGTSTQNGHVWLTSNSGNVTVSGNISAQNVDGSGGRVTLRGANIANTGSIDASATKANKAGGDISIIAKNTTTVDGTISAKGGSHGAGGNIETSGEHVHVANSAKISTLSKNGQSGDWLIDPTDFTIAASGGDITGTTLSSELSSSCVTIYSSNGSHSGNGDINVNANVTISSSGTQLFLNAYRNINVNAPISVTNGGALHLVAADQSQTGTNDGVAADGDLVFGANGNVKFTDVVSNVTQGNLTINGVGYVLVNSIAQLATDITSTPGGHYALANDYDASSDNSGSAYTGAVVTPSFTGGFEGLGHTVSNLSIATATGTSYVGLFSSVSGGTVRDISLVDANVSATGDGSYVGALVGYFTTGTIENAHASGTVLGGSGGRAGGLIGLISSNSGSAVMSGDSAAVDVTGNGIWAGGLIGDAALNSGGTITLTISNSYATGNVSGSAGTLGGFAGQIGNNGGTYTITNTYATGNVTGSSNANAVGGYAGGIGSNSSDITISGSYATGAVNGANSNGGTGGFVGDLGGNGGSIHVTASYSTGSVSSGYAAGGFAGEIGGNGGSITVANSYATGIASGASEAGGFSGTVGGNGSSLSISTSYATGSASGAYNAGGFAGTLGGNGGSVTISDTYATGNASAGEFGNAGGFAGETFSHNSAPVSISTSYALGTASGGSESGGFVGYDGAPATFTSDYWDTSTSGFTNAAGTSTPANVTGLTSTQLMAALPSGFSSSTWKVVAGKSMPYLNWQFSGTPQAVSGTTTSGYNGTAVSAVAVDLADNGAALGTTSSYADGSYFFLLAPGTIASGSQVIAYRDDGNGGAFKENASGSLTGLTIADGFFTANLTAANMTLANQDIATAAGDITAAVNATEAPDGTVINSAATSFNFNTSNDFGTTLVINQANGSVTQSGHFSDLLNLLLLGNANYTLNSSSNKFSTLASHGNGTINIKDDATLTVGTVDGVNGINAGSHSVTLTTTGSGHKLNVNGTLAGGTVTLVSSDQVAENLTSGVITATMLSGSSSSTTSLNGANMITNLGAFGTDGSHAFSLTDARDLTVTGAVNAGTSNITLTTAGAGDDINLNSTLTGSTVKLVSAGAITESATTGKIAATTLDGSSVSTASLKGANVITDLGKFSTDGGHALALTDAHDLTVTGALNTGTHNITLTTTGAGHDINLNSGIVAGMITLVSGGAITEDATHGKITAKTLTGSSVSTASLNGANVITNLGAFSTDGGHALGLTDARDLTVTGALNTGTHNITLTTTGSGHDINLNSTLTAGIIKLVSAGAITESAAHGVMTAATLTGSSVSTASLKGVNVVTDLGAFSTDGGHALSLTDAHDLTVTGAVNTGTHNITLATTGSGHDINLNGTLTASTVTLASAGAITEDSTKGKIKATTLTGSAVSTASLKGANVITNLAAFTVGNHALSLTDAHDLTLTAAVTAGTGAVTLTTTGVGHDVTLNSTLKGGTVKLASAGKISESTTKGKITATTLAGTSGGAVSLIGANAITGLGAFNTSNHNLSLTDAGDLTVTGAVNTGTQNVALTTTGSGHDIAINGSLTGATDTLVAAGEITEGSKGSVTATALLNVTAKTGIDLDSSHNHIKKVGTRKTTSGPNTIKGIGS